MVEIQGGEGFLIDEFFSPVVNTREDEYGGSLANRYRFLQEIITAIRSFYQNSLWVRLSLDEYVKAEEQNKISEWQRSVTGSNAMELTASALQLVVCLIKDQIINMKVDKFRMQLR